MSPDTMSSLFPERPIRPLPTRRLRERLSPDAADSIQYPPAPTSIGPLFYYPYHGKDAGPEPPVRIVTRARPAQHLDGAYLSRGFESDEDGAGVEVQRSGRLSSPSPRLSRPPVKQEPPEAQPPLSAASSPDGYDSFENTNNKKKRKVPIPGDGSLAGGHVSEADVPARVISVMTSSLELNRECALRSIEGTTK